MSLLPSFGDSHSRIRGNLTSVNSRAWTIPFVNLVTRNQNEHRTNEKRSGTSDLRNLKCHPVQNDQAGLLSGTGVAYGRAVRGVDSRRGRTVDQ